MDIIDEIKKILDENSTLIKDNTRLTEEVAFLKSLAEKLKDREKLYMSALQNTKNNLEKLAKGIDTTPHSRDKEYGIKYYNESEE